MRYTAPSHLGIACALLLSAAVAGDAAARQETARYLLTFESTWSASTHPEGFPANPHFSGLVGAVHDSRVSFWMPGEEASPGIEAMAELGSKTLLLAEVAEALGQGTAAAELSGGGIALSPGSVTLEFEAHEDFPLLTIVSMVAPSPDWFVGVTALPLRDVGGWLPSLQVELVVYDAGTDSGTDYTSENADTQPRELITALTEPPFDQEQVLGVFRVERIDATGVSGRGELPGDLEIAAAFPNPATTSIELRVDGSVPAGLAVYDLLGRLRHRGRAAPGESVRLDVSAWPAGLYLVRAEAAGGGRTRTFIVER
jgi:hypothetical protein